MERLVRCLLLGLICAVPVAAQVPTINEMNYDDDGVDHEEFVEIYRAGGGNYANYDLVFYNGSNGAEYRRINLGTIPADGYLVIGSNGVPNVDIVVPTVSGGFFQNGAPDGVAIVQIAPAQCIEFLSYEGAFTAVGGECGGVGSTDIGVADVDPTSPAADVVLQRVPNATGAFAATGDGVANGVAQDGTPGLPNAAGPTAVGKLTTLGQNSAAISVELCVTGGQPPYTYTIRSLPLHGDLSDDNGVLIAPRNLVGLLEYTPDPGYSGLDSFTYSVTDAQVLDSAIVTQELGVQADSVVISEIMHSPSGDDRIFEFVEIYNKSASPVALTRLDVSPESTINTVGNINVSIPANSMRILAIDSTTNGAGFELDRILCEWRLTEAEVIRIPYAQWEFIFAAPDSASCAASQGSRVLLFGAGDVLLDALDLALVGAFECANSSYVYAPDFFPPPLTSLSNDDVLNWWCADVSGYGQRTGDISGDKANPKYVPGYIESPTYALPCFGSCCLTNGDCLAGVTQAECLEQRCGLSGGYTQGGTCDAGTMATCQAGADVDQHCCLPIGGACIPAGECECLLLNGIWDGNQTCAQDPVCEVLVGVVVNELEYDNSGTETVEFIELYGTPSTSLAGWTLEFFNGNDTSGDNIYRTVDLSLAPGGMMPADGYLVVGSNEVPNVDLPAWTVSGIQNGDPNGDGVALLFNNAVIESFSYFSGTNGFTAVGGLANGTFLTDIGVVDTAITTLQKLPDGGTWTSTGNNTPGETNFNAGTVGACCNLLDETCTLTLPADCTSTGLAYQGEGTSCTPNPCIPTGACCRPDGTCLANVWEDTCLNLLGGTWRGPDSTCPDIAAFTGCLAGPNGGLGANCGPSDYDLDSDVDLKDFWTYQQTLCSADPAGACCLPNGTCAEISAWDCTTYYGPAAWNGAGSLCVSTTCVPQPAGAVRINEIWAEDPGPDDNEFIELYGTPGASLSGMSLIIVDGDTDGDTAASAYRRVILQADLTGYVLDANGFFVMGSGPLAAPPFADVDLDLTFGNANLLIDEIQNGSQTYALVHTADVALCTSNGIPDAYCINGGNQLTEASVAAITANAVDTVATRYGLFNHFYFYAPLVQDSGVYQFDYAQRIPNGVDTNVAADWETTYGYELNAAGDPSSIGTVNQAQSTVSGACCLESGCRVLLDAACVTSNGTWMGYGTTCTPDPCLCRSIAEEDYVTYPETRQACITGAIITSDYDMLNSLASKQFYIQDPTGTRAMAIYGTNADIDALLAVATAGDAIEIRGLHQEYFQLQELTAPFTIVVLGSPGVPAPLELTIADLKTAITDLATDPRRAWIGSYVKVVNAEFTVTGNFAYGNYTIRDATTPTDTMTLRISNGQAGVLPILGTPIPSGPVDIVGITATFSNLFQIQPRVPEDITPH